MDLLLKFIILNILNVILSTIKSICTLKGSKLVAALANAISYAIYTLVIIYTVCDLNIYLKMLVVAICNFIGVYIVKWVEEKSKRVKFWKIEITVKPEQEGFATETLDTNDIIYTKTASEGCLNNYVLFNCLCRTKDETRLVHRLIDATEAHYFISESKDF